MENNNNIKLSFLASMHDKSQEALGVLSQKYGNVSPEEADVIVTLGGDGFLLETIHKYINVNKPIFPINCGSIGYLLNSYDDRDVFSRLQDSEKFILHPLAVEIEHQDGSVDKNMALNEASLLRMSRQAANVKISINDEVRMEKLIGDGVLVATSLGSTAYNSSAGGEVLPLTSNLLALTPICALSPKRWQGAVINDDVNVLFEVLDGDKRPVKAEMDFFEYPNIKKMSTYIDKDKTYTLLFDKDSGLEEKILEEQFPSEVSINK